MSLKRFYFSKGIFICLLILGASPNVYAEIDPVFRVKAVCLYNFAKFIKWPSSAFKSPTDPFRICIVGENPFGELLNELGSRDIEGRRISLSFESSLSSSFQVQSCHILYSHGLNREKEGQIEALIGNAPVVTVSDDDNSNAIIQFLIIEDKVRFKILADTASARSLVISSQLLKLAYNE